MYSCSYSRSLPVQVGLLGSKEAEIELLGRGVIGPGTVGITEKLAPIVRRLWVAIGVESFRIFPNVPITFD